MQQLRVQTRTNASETLATLLYRLLPRIFMDSVATVHKHPAAPWATVATEVSHIHLADFSRCNYKHNACWNIWVFLNIDKQTVMTRKLHSSRLWSSSPGLKIVTNSTTVHSVIVPISTGSRSQSLAGLVRHCFVEHGIIVYCGSPLSFSNLEHISRSSPLLDTNIQRNSIALVLKQLPVS